MFISFLTPEHDRHATIILTNVVENCKNLQQMSAAITINSIRALTSKIYSKSQELTPENIYEKTDDILLLMRNINELKSLAHEFETQPNSKDGSKLAPFKPSTDRAIKDLQQLSYLVELKIKDKEITRLDEFVGKASQEMLQIQNGLTNLQQLYPSLSEKVTAELIKAEDEYINFVSFVKEKSNIISDLTGAVSAEVIAKEYLLKSKEEKLQADKFRQYAITSLLSTSALLAFTLLVFLGSAIASSLPTSLTAGITVEPISIPSSMVFFAFTLLIPAAYFGRESQNHRKLELTNLKTSQDLKSFLPFIESLPEKEQIMIKTLLAANMFTKNNTPDSKDDFSPVFLQDLILKMSTPKQDTTPK